MSTPEGYARTIGLINDRMWAQAEPLEKKLRDLETEYQALRKRPVTDVAATAGAIYLEPKIKEVSDKLNKIYEDWQRNLTLIAPPTPTAKKDGEWKKKIPWPKAVPPEVRRFVLRAIDQGGLPISRRVTLKPVTLPFGGQGVAIEFGKW